MNKTIQNPINILKKNILKSDILEMKKLNYKSFNEIWKCKVSNINYVFFKIQHKGKRFNSLEHEAKVLSLLKKTPLIPKLIISGFDSDSNRHYLATLEIAGVTLYKAIQQGLSVSSFDKISNNLLNWLKGMQNQKTLHKLLEDRVKTSTNIYKPNFDPIASSLKILKRKNAKISKKLKKIFLGILRSSTHSKNDVKNDIVQGSLTTFNILILKKKKKSQLIGIVDFEAARLGNLMYDIGMLLLYLLMSPNPMLSINWYLTAKKKFNSKKFKCEVLSFFIYLYLARLYFLKNNYTRFLPSPKLVEFFLKLV